jgi:pimeloyl-ACP methyl ester carboxylesterase
VRSPIIFIHGAFSAHRHFAGWSEYFSRAGFECHSLSLPAHPTANADELTSLGLGDYLAALKNQLPKLAEPPIIVGHSMGGLLAQHLAATVPCRALVCVASAPPWMLSIQPRTLRSVLPVLPAILAAQPFALSPAMIRYLAAHDLPESEQQELVASFVPESGRAIRGMIFGLARLPRKSFEGPVLCLSGRKDRMISNRDTHAVARFYGARHEVFDRGHWLIAPSAQQEVAGSVLRWLKSVSEHRDGIDGRSRRVG